MSELVWKLQVSLPAPVCCHGMRNWRFSSKNPKPFKTPVKRFQQNLHSNFPFLVTECKEAQSALSNTFSAAETSKGWVTYCKHIIPFDSRLLEHKPASMLQIIRHSATWVNLLGFGSTQDNQYFSTYILQFENSWTGQLVGQNPTSVPCVRFYLLHSHYCQIQTYWCI